MVLLIYNIVNYRMNLASIYGPRDANLLSMQSQYRLEVTIHEGGVKCRGGKWVGLIPAHRATTF